MFHHKQYYWETDNHTEVVVSLQFNKEMIASIARDENQIYEKYIILKVMQSTQQLQNDPLTKETNHNHIIALYVLAIRQAACIHTSIETKSCQAALLLKSHLLNCYGFSYIYTCYNVSLYTITRLKLNQAKLRSSFHDALQLHVHLMNS